MKQAEDIQATGSIMAGAKGNDTKPFRIIIAGAGVAGLAMSHALVKAGIDHVVLEKGVPAPDWGASISLWGNGSRLLSQIGVLDVLEAEALPLKYLHTRDYSGRSFCSEPFFDMMKERYLDRRAMNP
jgi:2-polyprenyl-6-methoxyphenol hydroxylase-like FAD-dependent oxidoreductase